MSQRICTVEGCGRPHKGRGLCQVHFMRDRNHHPEGIPSYLTVHERLAVKRGLARRQTCVDCGAPAREWSLSHDAPAIYTPGGQRYSPDLAAYSPRCISCHRLYDKGVMVKR
jgi:hypothetical protein